MEFVGKFHCKFIWSTIKLSLMAVAKSYFFVRCSYKGRKGAKMKNSEQNN